MPDPSYFVKRFYTNITIALATTLAIILIAFGTIFAASQPATTQIAEAKPRLTEPLLDRQAVAYYDPVADQAIDRALGQEPAEPDGGAASSDDPSTEEILATIYPVKIDELLGPEVSSEELAHTNAKYLATFLALGRYEGLEGAQPLYEEMLASLGINFLDYSSLAEEIEAVSNGLEAAPDLWQHFADQTVASGLLPV